MSEASLDESTFTVIKNLQNHLEIIYRQVSNERKGLLFAKSFLHSHFQDTSNRLKNLYVQHYQTLDDFPHREWFDETSKSLEKFAESFSARAPLKFIGSSSATVKTVVSFPGIVSLLALMGFTSSAISALVSKCFCHGMTLFTIYAPFLIVAWLVYGFQRKRQVLLERDVYGLEERLLRLLGSDRKPEVQLDVLGWFLGSLVLLLGAFVLRPYQATWVITLFTVAGFVFLAIAVVTAIQSSKRPWAWSASGGLSSEHQ
jgi:ABC-type multidrug transport system fused ATPase/permease subunit